MTRYGKIAKTNKGIKIETTLSSVPIEVAENDIDNYCEGLSNEIDAMDNFDGEVDFELYCNLVDTLNAIEDITY